MMNKKIALFIALVLAIGIVHFFLPADVAERVASTVDVMSGLMSVGITVFSFLPQPQDK
jgi:hypothetical protein